MNVEVAGSGVPDPIVSAASVEARQHSPKRKTSHTFKGRSHRE